jgi:hypothetical protein
MIAEGGMNMREDGNPLPPNTINQTTVLELLVILLQNSKL